MGSKTSSLLLFSLAAICSFVFLHTLNQLAHCQLSNTYPIAMAPGSFHLVNFWDPSPLAKVLKMKLLYNNTILGHFDGASMFIKIIFLKAPFSSTHLLSILEDNLIWWHFCSSLKECEQNLECYPISMSQQFLIGKSYIESGDENHFLRIGRHLNLKTKSTLNFSCQDSSGLTGLH